MTKQEIFAIDNAIGDIFKMANSAMLAEMVIPAKKHPDDNNGPNDRAYLAEEKAIEQRYSPLFLALQNVTDKLDTLT